MGDTEYSVFDTTNSGIDIDYWRDIVRYLYPFLDDLLNFVDKKLVNH
jgi:hypothetical protein